MRIVTVGVLIVAGGTLAALPFRRYQTIPDASSSPGQLTGPSHSILHDESAESQLAIESMPSPPMPKPGEFNQSTPSWAPPSQRPRAPRQLDIPLTFEDLSVPLVAPDPLKERYSATVDVQRERRQRQRVEELTMPSIDTLAPGQLQQIHEAASQFAPPLPDPRAGGSLASAGSPPPSVQPRPTFQPEARIRGAARSAQPSRQRHWIRQPD